MMNNTFTEKEAAFWESGFRGHKPIVCPRHPRYQGKCVGYVRNILSPSLLCVTTNIGRA